MSFAYLISNYLIELLRPRMARLVGLFLSDFDVRQSFKHPSLSEHELYSTAAQVLCSSQAEVETALASIHKDVNVLVINFFGGILTRVPLTTNVREHTVSVVSPIQSMLLEFVTANADTRIYIVPPPYRRAPIWYRDKLYIVLHEFNQVFNGAPQAIKILPAYHDAELLPDGSNLTPDSLIGFLRHVALSIEAITSIEPWSVADKISLVLSKNQQLDMQVQALQSDHNRLKADFECKFAIDCELADWNTNKAEEDSVVVTGLPKPPANLDSREFQRVTCLAVQKLVDALIATSPPKVKYIRNMSGGRAGMTIDAKFATTTEARMVRDRFALFFKPNPPARPDCLWDVNLRNKVLIAYIFDLGDAQIF